MVATNFSSECLGHSATERFVVACLGHAEDRTLTFIKHQRVCHSQPIPISVRLLIILWLFGNEPFILGQSDNRVFFI